MSSDFSPTVFSLDALTAMVRLSRGWFRQIVRDTGCRYTTLRRMANEGWSPRLDEAELISGWFVRYGIPDAHPHVLRARAARAQRDAGTPQ